MRICLVSAAYHPYPSGVSEHVHNLAQALHRLGQSVHVLTTRFPTPQSPTQGSGSRPQSPIPDPRSPIPVTRLGRAVLVPMNRSYATVPVGLRLAADVKRFFRENRFDVVHCHGMFWPEISYWAIRYSEAVRVVSFLTAGFRIRTWGAGVFRSLFRGQLGRIDGLVPISNRAWHAFQAYVPGEPRIIPCGVDLDRFRPGLEPLPAREPDRPTVLFLGRLDRRKGLSVLLRAMPDVLQAVPGTRLVVVGKGPEEGHARALCSRLGIEPVVVFCGPAKGENLARYYCGCDVFCSPALGGETLGIVLLEAMASGAPVVASDIPGYDETVEHGTSGLLVPPAQPAALARGLVEVLSDHDLRIRLTSGGLERAKRYAWPLVARRTLDYYEELLSRRRQTS